MLFRAGSVALKEKGLTANAKEDFKYVQRQILQIRLLHEFISCMDGKQHSSNHIHAAVFISSNYHQLLGNHVIECRYLRSPDDVGAFYDSYIYFF